MDESDIRKLCTALENQQNLNQDTFNKLKEKSKILRQDKHVDEDHFYFSKPKSNWNEFPIAYKFWIRVALLKDFLFAKLSLK
jgi:hypothetical protein